TVNPAVVGTPTIVAFAADPIAIEEGASSTLSWSVGNAASVVIEPGIGAVGASGAVSVSPAVTTTYTLTATNVNGVVTAQVSITVVPVITGNPVILFFSANPSTLTIGGSS